MLQANGLRMIGFDLNTSRDCHSYRLTYPDDPSVANHDKVRAFEIKNPSAFTSQYTFWSQKVKTMYLCVVFSMKQATVEQHCVSIVMSLLEDIPGFEAFRMPISCFQEKV